MTADLIERLIPSLAKKLGEFLKPSVCTQSRYTTCLSPCQRTSRTTGLTVTAVLSAMSISMHRSRLHRSRLVKSSGMQRHDNRFMTAVAEIHVVSNQHVVMN
jgi:hypothetical protein